MSQGLVDTIAVTGILLLVLCELRSPSFRRSTFSDKRRIRRNLLYLAASLGTMLLLNRFTQLSSRHLPALFDWKEHTILNLGGCFLFAELYSYLFHRAMHAHPFLWRFHFQHHVETEYNVWLTAHTNALQVIVSGAILSALLQLAGFSLFSVQIYFLFYGFVNTYQHSGLDWSLGPLDSLIVGPAYHRRHHALGTHGNFGDALTFWDRVLGSVIDKEPAPRYGLTPGGDEPYGWLPETFWFLDRSDATRIDPFPGVDESSAR